MDELRARAVARKQGAQEPRVLAFHKAFLNSIRAHGRVFEMGMIAGYKLRSGDFFTDMGLGLQMMKRNKIKFTPVRIQGRKEVKALFKKSKEEK